MPAEFVAVLLVGCLLMVLVLRRLERVLPPVANGLTVSSISARSPT
jgi:xanthine/uracil permease